MLLTHRKLLQPNVVAIDNDLCGALRNFGLTVGTAGMVKFEARIKVPVANLPGAGQVGGAVGHCPAGDLRAVRRSASPLVGYRSTSRA
jgi:hypothetical protein